MALLSGATFVARSFSGDKKQVVPILKAAITHRGFAFVDVISPCVTFNDHEGSTKSYAHTREHKVDVVQADFVPRREEITTDYAAGSLQNVMLHDGSWVKLRKLAEDYDPTNRDAAYSYVREHQKKGEVVTGLLYLNADSQDVHQQNDTVGAPLYNMPHDQLCPGNAALQALVGVPVASLFANSAPIFSIALAAAMGREPTWLQLVGGAIVMGGIGQHQLRQVRAARR